MIIQIRGTSGSGKTTVIHRVRERLPDWTPKYRAGRKRPLYYRRGGVVLLGHYETACGGCDSIGSARAVYELIQDVGDVPLILAEGLLLSEDVKWSSQLADLRVLYLATPVEQCLEQIRSRRAEAGNDKPLNEANTRNRVAVIERGRAKLEALGVRCETVSVGQAVERIMREIGRAYHATR